MNCATCVFYSVPNRTSSTGTCDYPIPEWLRLMPSGNWIPNPEYSGQECATYKSRADVLAAEIKEPQP